MEHRSSRSRLTNESSTYSELNFASALVKASPDSEKYFNADELFLKARMLVAPLLATASSTQQEVKWTDLEKLGKHTMLSWGKIQSEKKKSQAIVKAVARIPAKV
jgi:hypothetical protein